jgi:hypothetical protein
MKSESLTLEKPQFKEQGAAKWPQWLENFVDIYQKLSTDNLALISSIYHEDITFIDPLHKVEGLVDLHKYFEGLYTNLSQCDFVINNVIVNEEQAAIYWEMAYQHPKLNRGEEVVVSGTSLIIGKNNKVIYHRDYLDVGTMLYEQLPIIGRVIKWIKIKAAS